MSIKSSFGRTEPSGQGIRKVLCRMVFTLSLSTLLLNVVSAAEIGGVAADTLAPLAAIQRFDSLFDIKQYAEAKKLCRGSALRLFDLLVMGHKKIGDAIDTSQSTESYEHVYLNLPFAGYRSRSHVVFKRPMMGMKELNSFQAIHLIWKDSSWFIWEFAELPNEYAALPKPSLETITSEEKHSLLPFSSRRYRGPARIDSMDLSISLSSGNRLDSLFENSPGQEIIERQDANHWTLRIRSAKVPADKAKNAHSKNRRHDKLSRYLQANSYLVLQDTALLKLSTSLRETHSNTLSQIQAVYDWVRSHMHFKLGAVLISPSDEILAKLEGDCTEAAILSVALLRSLKIPARMVIGYATQGDGLFVGHAWVEAWLDSRMSWLAFDPALGQFPADAKRVQFKALDEELELRMQATNLLLKSLGSLQFEIRDVWSGSQRQSLEQSESSNPEEFFFQKVFGEAN